MQNYYELDRQQLIKMDGQQLYQIYRYHLNKMDCYKLLGTSKRAVENIKDGEAEQNRVIKDHYAGEIRLLDSFIENAVKANNRDKKEQLEMVKKICEKAYQQVKDAKARRNHEEVRRRYEEIQERYEEALRQEASEEARNEELRKMQDENLIKIRKSKEEFEKIIQKNREKINTKEMKSENEYYDTKELSKETEKQSSAKEKRERFTKQYVFSPQIDKTAYGVLDILPPDLEKDSAEQDDKRIAENAKKFKEEALETLLASEKPIDSIEQLDALLERIQKIDQNYPLIANLEAREQYEQYLKYRKVKIDRKQQIEDRYSHIEECDFDLIRNQKEQDNSLQGKVIKRVGMELQKYCLEDSEERKLELQQIGIIMYQNATEDEPKNIYKFRVKRNIGGKNLWNICYSTQPITEIFMQKRAGAKFDKGLYQCIVEQLFSEELIEGSEYNGGFIGGIEKDKEGNYHPTLGKEKLSKKEQEALTVILALEQIRREKKEKGEER